MKLSVALGLLLLIPFGGGAQTAGQDSGVYAAVLTECYASARDSDAKRACIDRFADLCMKDLDDGLTTVGMSGCELAELLAWELLLEAEYTDAVITARGRDSVEREFSPAFAALEDTLRAAQQAWRVFRDANCGLRHALWGAGSMRSVDAAFCQMSMTAERTIELHEMFHQEN